MAQQASIVQEGVDRVRAAFGSLEDEFERVQRQLRARRRNLTHFLERHRESTTMSLSKRDVEKIAHLARLQIAEEQIETYNRQEKAAVK